MFTVSVLNLTGEFDTGYLRSPSRFSATALSITRIDESFCFLFDTRADEPSDVPHSSQNFAPGLFLEPHLAHEASVGAAHSLQNFAPRDSRLHTSRTSLSGTQLIEEGFGVLQIGGIESFSEPVVDLGEHRAPLVASALSNK